MKSILLIGIWNLLINFSIQFGNLNCINFVQISNSYEENLILQRLKPTPVTLTSYRNISLIKANRCEFYLIVINSELLFRKLRVVEQLKSFSKILLILKDVTVTEDLHNRYLMNPTLNIISVDYRDVLENKLNGGKLFNEDKFIDRLIKNSERVMEIRASFFHCSPNVMYLDNYIDLKFRGFEYKIFSEITKNWKVNYTLRDFSDAITDPWETSLLDIQMNISDIVFCSIWLTEYHGTTYDCSSYVDYQCITFLAPKPYPLHQASYIYLPFCKKVWILFLVMIVVTAFALKIIAAIELKIYSCLDHKFSSLYQAFNEIISITVLSNFSKFPHLLPTNIIITSWIIHLLILTTGYSTGYTSLLTSPPYSKPIDTLRDFIEQDIYWGEYGPRPHRIEELKATGIDDFIELANRMIVEKDLSHRLKLLGTRKYARSIKIVDRNFIAEADTFPQFSDSMRLMKQCINNYYTIFAFKKDSPYTKIFNRQIIRMREAGLIKFWIHDMHHTPAYMKKYFVNPIENEHKTKKLTFVNLMGAFYLLFGGLCTGFCIFLVELYWKK